MCSCKFPELNEISHNVKRKCILGGEIVVLRNGVPEFYPSFHGIPSSLAISFT